MNIPDVNLLVYAYNRGAPHHRRAKAWWEELLSGSQPVGIPWAVVCGFVRLCTHPAVLTAPLSPVTAVRHVRSWLEVPVAEIVEPGPRHLETLERLFGSLGVGANLTTDAHLAAIAIEHQAELHSNDVDFARFPGLRWRNPL